MCFLKKKSILEYFPSLFFGSMSIYIKQFDFYIKEKYYTYSYICVSGTVTTDDIGNLLLQ